MNTDQLQQFIFKKIVDIKKLAKSNTNPEYNKAINDVVEMLDKNRKDIVDAHAVLKEVGIIS